MKITDYALIFIAVTIPFMLMAYVNIAFIIRTYQQEMYYQRVIDSAVEDSINQMKTIENDEVLNDYGYSGEVDNKISINAEVAVSTFFDSFYNNLDLYADKATQELIQYYVPVIAVIDYNGVYISSIEKIDGLARHVLKPKRYFSYTYALDKDGNYYTIKDNKWVKENNINEITDDVIMPDDYDKHFVSLHSVEFTTDDRIFHTVRQKKIEYNVPIISDGKVIGLTSKEKWVQLDTKEFYMSDEENNERLFLGVEGSNLETAKSVILNNLKSIRKEVLVDIVTEELTYAANKNNEFAHERGISYNFSFTVDSDDEMYNYIQNVGMLALVQGIKVGNKYLNYKAYNVSDLVLTHKYYLTESPAGESKFASRLYHKTKDCLEYKAYAKDTVVTNNKVYGVYNISYNQNITYTKEMAAILGYYPCPLCNP